MALWQPRQRQDGGFDASTENLTRFGGDNGDARPEILRTSNALQSMLERLSRARALNILDLGFLTAGTAQFLGNLGHNLYYASLIDGFDAFVRSRSEDQGRNLDRDTARKFVLSRLGFRPGTFHAVLAWDVLQYLDAETARATVSQLAKIVQPNGGLLYVFRCDESTKPARALQCAVVSGHEFAFKESPHLRPCHRFTVRDVEALFPQFRAVHFHLQRDAMLEVLVLK